MDERLKVYDEKMTKSYDSMMRDFQSIRAGRANPHVLDKIRVDYYGTPTPLQQVGNISVPDPAGLPVNPDRRIPSLLRLHKRGQTVILKMSKLRGADTQAVLSIRFDA